MHKIAVILSLYRNDKVDYVKLAINSILEQTYDNFDLFIIFDGPVDLDVDKYVSSIEDERVYVKKRKENKGLAFSLNELLQEIIPKNYEFIARMDADDISCKDRFEKQIEYLCHNHGVDVVGGAINEIDQDGKPRNKVVRYPLNNDECRIFFAKRNPIAHPTVMFRKTFFDKIKCLYPTEYIRNEDTALWLEAFKHDAKMANLSDVVLNFRVTPAFFYQRRNGKTFAKSQLELRKKISKELRFGPMSLFYAYAMYLLMVSPSWLIKIAYKVFR